MISLNDATLRRGSRVLLEKTTFTIFPGYKVGVVGRNGTGKTSLFALLLGELHTDAGEATMPKNLAIATVAQETPALPIPAIEFALDGDFELRKVERELAIAEEKHDADGIGHGHERLGQIDGYSARARAAQLLRGLGFAPETQDRAVADFSGGWRMRLNLARALMCRSDLLLLDEPTNHLDLDAVIWLQDYLVEYPGTLLIISHDREFLDAVTTHTLHLERLGATLYSGNYSGFERLRAEKLAQQAATFAQQQLRVAHLQSFITRFKAKASKARQAQSRIKQLERMELIAPAHWDSEFQFEFLEPDRVPSPLLKLDDVRAGYPERTILEHVKLSLEPGDRIGLLGANGAGKSTLIRTLAGELNILAGHTHRDPHLRIGYFAQHQLEHLDPKASPLLHFKRLAPQASEQSLRNFLGGFAFVGDRVFEAVEPFSGGEKARLALALVVWQKPNLLLLDEPTNHLDLDMRYALETALQEFGGAMILVSHDRHLLSSTCDEFWRVADGRVQPFDGDLDDYARWLTTGRDPGKSDAAPKDRNRNSAKDQRKASADERERLRQLRDATGKLEKRMNKLQAELAQLEKILADQDLYSETRRAELAKHLQKQSETKKQLAQIESEWLAASEELETL